MKQIVKLEPNRFIHLDSYFKSHETRGLEAVVFIIFTLITAITIGGLVGADITHFNNTNTIQNHGKPVN